MTEEIMNQIRKLEGEVLDQLDFDKEEIVRIMLIEAAQDAQAALNKIKGVAAYIGMRRPKEVGK